jgi:regulatory protein
MVQKKNKDLFQAALRLLSFREHTRSELASKLLRRDFAAADIQLVCQELEEGGYLSDARVAAMCQSAALRDGRVSPRRLYEQLLRRGISSELAEETLSSYTEQVDEKEMALRLAHELAAKEKHSDFIKRFLSRRGFSSRAIVYAVERVYLDNTCSY